jgi:hypothetical protein
MVSCHRFQRKCTAHQDAIAVDPEPTEAYARRGLS